MSEMLEKCIVFALAGISAIVEPVAALVLRMGGENDVAIALTC